MKTRSTFLFSITMLLLTTLFYCCEDETPIPETSITPDVEKEETQTSNRSKWLDQPVIAPSPEDTKRIMTDQTKPAGILTFTNTSNTEQELTSITFKIGGGGAEVVAELNYETHHGDMTIIHYFPISNNRCTVLYEGKIPAKSTIELELFYKTIGYLPDNIKEGDPISLEMISVKTKESNVTLPLTGKMPEAIELGKISIQKPGYIGVACASTYTFAIKTGGTLWTCGYGSIGRMKQEGKIGASDNFAQVACSLDGNIFLKADGTIWGSGHLHSAGIGTGDGRNVNPFTPTQIGSDNDWKSIYCGFHQAMGIKKDGTLWAWGINTDGVLGTGSTLNPDDFNSLKILSPTQVGNDNKWKQAAISSDYTIAVKTDGTLWAWGDNSNGTFGDGTQTDSPTPIQIGTQNDWDQVSNGFTFNLALKKDGTLWAWGRNDKGQLGNGTNYGSSIPVKVNEESDWAFIASGPDYSIAIKKNGTLWAWGLNDSGQIGDGTTINRNFPVQIGSDTDWRFVSCNKGSFSSDGNFSFAIKTDGSLWSWGLNHAMQLGDGTNNNRLTPVQVN